VPSRPPPSFVHAHTAKARKGPKLSNSIYAPAHPSESTGLASSLAICAELLLSVYEGCPPAEPSDDPTTTRTTEATSARGEQAVSCKWLHQMERSFSSRYGLVN
jgi:hypothetical protein